MIAIDTNLLIYAHRAGVPEHRAARGAIETAAAKPSGWGIALASVAEFWSVVTHPSAAGRPSTGAEAAAFLTSLVDQGGAAIWRGGAGFEDRLIRAAADLRLKGPRVFDLQIALMAREGGAREIWTHDASFIALPGLKRVFPLAHP